GTALLCPYRVVYLPENSCKFTLLLSHLVTVHKVKQVPMQAPFPFDISSNGDVERSQWLLALSHLLIFRSITHKSRA
ncbi:MAG: hypothetical protein ACYTX0_57785, partial [Nostoc sp.]